MQKKVVLLLMLVTLAPVQAGKKLRVHGNRFFFLIAEPAGWTVDLDSAVQIAHFVAYNQGTNWREADIVIFGRLMAKKNRETLEAFVKSDVRQFEERCPFYKIEDVQLEVKSTQRYLCKAYNCPGGRHEIVAVTEVPRFFAVFVLSSRQGEIPSHALPTFEEILTSFVWVETDSPR